MIRFTRPLFGMCLAACCALVISSCASGEGEAEAPQDDTMDTSSEVVSAEFPGGAAAVMKFISGAVTYPNPPRQTE